jgi:hypothetical protein
MKSSWMDLLDLTGGRETQPSDHTAAHGIFPIPERERRFLNLIVSRV